MAAADLSTGEFQLARAADFEGLAPEIAAFGPQEILYPSPAPPELAAFLAASGTYSSGLAPMAFEGAEEALFEVFGAGFRQNLPELWESPGGPAACGAAVKRLLGLAPGSSLSHLAPPALLWTSPSLSLDEAALRNLELVRSLRDGGTRGTLFELLDLSSTPMGSRTLQDWLVRPSRDRAEVEARHGAVEELLGDAAAREKLAGALKSLKDLERALSRLTLGRGAVRDLYLVKAALDLAPAIRDLLGAMDEGGMLRRIALGIAEVLEDGAGQGSVPEPAGARDGAGGGAQPDPFPASPAATLPSPDPAPAAATLPDPDPASPAAPLPASAPGPVGTGPGARAGAGRGGNAMRTLKRTLDACLGERPAPGSPEGAAIRDGCSPVLDELRELERDGRKAIAALESREKARTGLNFLKVGYNRVFGYYLELPRRLADQAPPEWTRRQTLSGTERFASPELMELEGKLLTAGERREALEQTILKGLKLRAAAASAGAKRLSKLMGVADALRSLAEAARKHGWTRPKLTQDDVIDITAGRHPVVEASLPRGEPFVANDVRLSPKERILVVTGPNMAGKSTILRQTAIIVILSQMGSFVPAERAKLSIRDAVFTRVGAADDLARGRSTFMVEMSETARILARATPRSLVVLDEVGRGTSTFDGLAIAWAVAEYLHDRAGRGVPTLFATHYHELVDLARSKPLAVNYNVAVRKWQGKVVFLRKLMPGGTSRSYGLAVAALAGLPKAVTGRAQEVLKDLLEGAKRSIRPEIRPRGLFADPVAPPDPEPQGLWAPDRLEDEADLETGAVPGGTFAPATTASVLGRAQPTGPDPEARQGFPSPSPRLYGTTAPSPSGGPYPFPSGAASPCPPAAASASPPPSLPGRPPVTAYGDPSAATPAAPAAPPPGLGTGSGRLAPSPLIEGGPGPDAERDKLIAEICAIETEALTPLEALNLVHALKTRAEGLL
jgi:DNA mismatch repair ATPase MutS